MIAKSNYVITSEELEAIRKVFEHYEYEARQDYENAPILQKTDHIYHSVHALKRVIKRNSF